MRCADHKIKKSQETMPLELTRTVDILAQVSLSKPRPFVVGFAAETDAVEQHASAKLLAKNLDLIAANEVGHSKAFDCDENALVVLWRGGRIELPAAPKRALARALTALIIERYLDRPAEEARVATRAS
jgi:phosphopantothenoylcysteine decarboxylase/phosphopantothenate--cysteine ligase